MPPPTNHNANLDLHKNARLLSLRHKSGFGTPNIIVYERNFLWPIKVFFVPLQKETNTTR